MKKSVIMKYAFFILLALGCYLSPRAQNLGHKGIMIGFGLNTQSFFEERFSARQRTNGGFSVHLAYDFGPNTQRHRIEVGFSKNFNQNQGQLLRFSNLKPELRYALLWPIKEQKIYLGGYWDLGALLSFPFSQKWDGNNSIAYSIWTSLGLKTEYTQRLAINKQNFQISTQLSIPLLGYVIRPAYGLPYPDQFLQDETFDFQRKNMGKHVLSSGRIKALNKFQNIRLRMGLNVPIGARKHELGLNYQLDFFQISEQKTVRLLYNTLVLSSKYKI